MGAAAVLPGNNGSPPAARLRRAAQADAAALADLYDCEAAQMSAWLKTGSVLLVENGSPTPLAAVRWQPDRLGWLVEPIVTLPSEQGQAYGRWLMTKLEAMAIKGNIARLELTLEDPLEVPYYRRLGYSTSGDDDLRLTKRVGGVWQRQAAGS